MREFILVDLESQIAFLPSEIRRQPREHFLYWMRQYGEVWEIERNRRPDVRAYSFRSWVGLRAGFALMDDGRLRLRGRTWSTYLRHDGPRYAEFRRRLAEAML